MAGYSPTPLWKKLGYKPNMEAYADSAPAEYVSQLALPKEMNVTWLARPKRGMSFAHVFCREKATLKRKLAGYRKQLASDGVLWVSWPKKASGIPSEIIEESVRKCALPMG